ncbi:MAG: heme o synthase [Acidobacteria bacterium]|jgi:protoheme IX farnesyltransferase|nr:heme o synthase [Acidobacteriota bacterium]
MEDEISARVFSHSEADGRSVRSLLTDYMELAKARLGALVVLTAFVGYVLGARDGGSLSGLAAVVVGTALSSFGANILNQWYESERDSLMLRTRERPLPAGRLDRRTAAVLGVVTASIGLAILAVATNWLTTFLSLFVILVYVLIYTPLKVRTPLNTVVGAVCGGVPPMMGWTAATGRLDAGAWILGGILFAWQIPHFLSLAWLYRDDYARGGFQMLPAVDEEGSLTGRLSFLYAVSLLPITAALTAFGITGGAFLIASQVIGIAFVGLGWLFLRARSQSTAKNLFLASILYLTVLLGLMVVDVDDRAVRGGNVAAKSAAHTVDEIEVAAMPFREGL